MSVRAGPPGSTPDGAELDALYGAVPVGLARLDAQRRLVRANARLATLLSTRVEHCVGRSLDEIATGLADVAASVWTRVSVRGETVRGIEVDVDTSVRTDAPSQVCWLTHWLPLHASPGVAGEVLLVLEDLSALRRAEHALRERDDDLRHTIDLNPQIPWTADASGRMTQVADRWLRLTGLTREQALGDERLEVRHPDDRDRLAQDWAHAVRTGETYHAEHRARMRDGRYRWMRSIAVPRRGASGAITRWYGFTEDVDDAHRAREATRASERRLQAILEHLPVGVVIAEAPDGGTILANRRFLEIAGRDPRQHALDGHPEVWSGRHPDGHPFDPADSPLMRALRDGEVAHGVSMRLARPDGGWVDTELAAAPIRDGTGAVVAAVTTVVDVTESRDAQRAITRRARQLQSLARAALAINAASTLEARLERVGRAACEIVGAREARVRLAPPVPSADAGRLDIPLVARDGRALGMLEIHPEATAATLDEGDEAIVVQLAQLASLSIEQLLAEDALRDADRRKDEFLAMLAHELRNPLAPLRTTLRILEREPLGERGRQSVGMATRQVRQLARLVDDLLEVSRITHGKIGLRCEPLMVQAAIYDVARGLAAALAARGQHLELDLPSRPITIRADPVRITQILENLLSNASKYTDRDGLIEVSLQRRDDKVEITVRDTGIGIAPEDLPRLFELFSQIDASLERSHGGLGIGLALVRQLAAMHGGSVDAESPGRGQGSTFRVRLPVGGPE